MEALQTARHGDVQSVDEYWKRQRDEWIADLTELNRLIVRWLQPVCDAKLATSKAVEFTLMEPDTGQYVAPGLEIGLLSATPRTIIVRPRGLRIVGLVQTGGARIFGARGRVDLECGVARETLLRFRDDGPTKWLSFSGGEKQELDEDLFFDLMARIADVDLK